MPSKLSTIFVGKLIFRYIGLGENDTSYSQNIPTFDIILKPIWE